MLKAYGMIASMVTVLQIGAQEVKHLALKNLPVKPVNELLTRGMVSGENGTIGYFTYKKGATVPTHQHTNEQYSLITFGSVLVKVDGKEIVVKAGEVIIIPPNIPHSFTALEDNTVDIDFFAPMRMDWLTGSDQYYSASVSDKTEIWDGKTGQPEIYASLDVAAGNIAYTSTGDLVFSNHPFFEPAIRVVRYDANKKITQPFPNLEWNTPRATDDHYLSNVLGIRNDVNGVVWMLDMGQRNDITPKIVGWNTYTDKLERIYYLPETVLAHTSQPNDMVVDTRHGVFIIADEGIGNGGDGSKAALILVDMNTGIARRLLEGTRTTLPENDPTMFGGKPLSVNGKPLLVGCDGITSDVNFEWVYYSPLNGTRIYRIKTEDLLNTTLTEKDLDQRIETYSAKPNNGGLSIDSDGNLYSTALETNSVAVILAKDRSVHTFMSDKQMLWPDGISYNAADGYMYVPAAQVHLGKAFNNGKNLAKAPFYIYRFKPLAKGLLGK